MKCGCKWSLAIVKWAGLVLVLVGLFLGGQYWLWLGKAYEVAPSAVYRSAQLSVSQLSRVLHEHKIQAILNLRGDNAGQTWYVKERALAAKENIVFYDLRLDSYSMPSKAQLLQLVHILQISPKPLLVHCDGGADRTGLASAIYLILQNKPISQAEKEYSLHYYVIFDSSVGKLVVPLYARWLKKNNLISSKQKFLTWLDQL